MADQDFDSFLDSDEPWAASTPSTGQDIDSFLDGNDPWEQPKSAPNASLYEMGKDLSIDLASGVVGFGESVVGIGDLVSGNLIGKGMAAIGYDPQRTREMLKSGYSEERQGELAEVEAAKGFLDKVVASVQNPGMALGAIVESTPYLLGSAALVRASATAMLSKAGLTAGSAEAAAFLNSAPVLTKLAKVGAVSEGAFAAGSIQEQARQEGRSYTESAPHALIAGANTALIGRIASRIPGFGDVETAAGTMGMTGGSSTLVDAIKSIGKGMFQEGVLEELPQSTQEQIFTNLALDKPWNEGVADAAAMGLVVGAGMGGTVSTMRALTGKKEFNPEEVANRIVDPGKTVEDALAEANAMMQEDGIDFNVDTAGTPVDTPTFDREAEIARLQGNYDEYSKRATEARNSGDIIAWRANTLSANNAKRELDGMKGVDFEQSANRSDISIMPEGTPLGADLNGKPDGIDVPLNIPSLDASLESDSAATERVARGEVISPANYNPYVNNTPIRAIDYSPPYAQRNPDAIAAFNDVDQKEQARLDEEYTQALRQKADQELKASLKEGAQAELLSRYSKDNAPENVAMRDALLGAYLRNKLGEDDAVKAEAEIVDSRYEDATAEQIEKLSANIDRFKKAEDGYLDDMVTTIAKYGGGINIEDAKAQGLMDVNQRAGISWMFTKNGQTIDELGEWLMERGFFPANQRPDANEVLSRLYDNIRGSKKYYSYAGQELQNMLDERQRLMDYEQGQEFDYMYDQEYYEPDLSAGETYLSELSYFALLEGVSPDTLNTILGMYADDAHYAAEAINGAISDAQDNARWVTTEQRKNIKDRFATAASERQDALDSENEEINAEQEYYREQLSPELYQELFETEPGFSLETQTEESLKADADRRANAEPDAEDIPSPNDFTLAGSDSNVDQAEARGQKNIFDAPAQPSPELIVKSDGTPFKSSKSAGISAKFAENSGAKIVPVEGGYAIQPVNATTPVEKAVENADIDEEWEMFPADTGSLNIPRAEMPQVKADHRGALVNFLKGRGIVSEKEDVPASTLKPTQAEFSPSKVLKARRYEGGDRSILVSADDYVVDGHHQWLAKQGDDIQVIRIDAPIQEVLAAVKEFPSTEQADGASNSGSDEVSRETQEGGAAPVSEISQDAANSDTKELTAAVKALTETIKGQGRQVEPAAEKSAPGEKIEDFGEKLEGARKDYYSKMEKAKELDIASNPMSKTWPEPNYQELLNNGVDPWIVAFVHAARDEVPAKPRKGWKLNSYVQKVELLRGISESLVNGNITKERLESSLAKDEYSSVKDAVGGRADLYERVGHDQSLKGIKLSVGNYSMYQGVEYKPAKQIWAVEKKANATAFGNFPSQIATGDTAEEAINNFVKVVKSGDFKESSKPKVRFEVYSYRSAPDKMIVGKKIGSNYIDMKSFEGDTARNDAREYIANNQEALESQLEAMKRIPKMRKDTNAPRIGEDYRGSTDVTPEMFQNEFGFRGVQFGNYVENSKRQDDLNRAYDGLMDLAAILNIPPKAISLNGELGLAFGARGGGGKNAASAHFEPDNIVINLTKREGAGSLAHEWWHSLDNYFDRKRGDKYEKNIGYMTERPYGLTNDATRQEMLDAFKLVRNSINESNMPNRAAKLDSRRSKDYWSTGREMAARSFETYVIAKLHDNGLSNDYLANVELEEAWNASADLGMELENSYPYPNAEEVGEISAAFDNFFNIIESKNTKQGTALFSRAYHGSPYIFNKFNFDAVGSGEGAQAYGWGMYFAGNKAVAEAYRDSFNAEGGRWQSDMVISPLAESTANSFREDLPGAIRHLKNEKRENPINPVLGDMTAKYDEAISHLKILKNKGRFVNDASLYKVNLPDDNFLIDWDKSFSEQPEEIKEQFESAIRDEFGNSFMDAVIDYDQGNKSAIKDAGYNIFDYPGAAGGIYDMVAVERGQRGASEYFNIYGIPGLKYLDQESRGAGSGSYNYVIWSEESINIEDRAIFSSLQSDQGQIGSSVEMVKSAIADAVKSLNAELAVNVVGKVTELPESIKSQMEPGARYKGVYMDGSVYLIAENIRNARDARVVLAHELIGHKGVLEMATPEEWSAIKDEIARLIKLNSKSMSSIVDEVTARYGDLDQETKFKEILAIAAERRVKTGAIGRLVSKLKEIIRRFLKSVGLRGPFSDSDLDIILSNSERYLRESGRNDAPGMGAAFSSDERSEYEQAVAKGLDMSKEARMERARKMGFDTETVYYHGTTESYNEFEVQENGYPAFYFTSNRKIAADSSMAPKHKAYGRNGKPAVNKYLLRIDNPKLVSPEDSMFLSEKKVREFALGGFDGLVSLDEKGREVETVVFNSKQIRSVNAAFDPEYQDSGNLLASSNDSPEWYSALTKAAQSLKQEKGTPEQMLNAMRKMGGVKDEEIEWTGLPEFLRAQGKSVTKKDLVDFLSGNGVQVETVEISDGPNPYADMPIVSTEYNEDSGYWYVEFEDGNEVSIRQFEAETEEDANAAARDEAGEGDSGLTVTSYSKHTLPGGENYREVLLTLPTKSTASRPVQMDDGKWTLDVGRGQRIGEYNSEVKALEASKNIPTTETYQNDFTSTHFSDTKNILAHIRLNDRLDSDGNKVLFVEEIQSDWHQEGRSKGYSMGKDAANKEINEILGDGSLTDLPESEQERLISIAKAAESGVPNAPFKNNAWVELAAKKVLRMAAEGGYSSVAWTTGEQQADRYDLSKQISQIDIFNNGDGTFDLMAHTDQPITDIRDMTVINEQKISLERIESLVGKELAEKAKAQAKGLRIYKGNDLKIGGEGMKSFYDQTLPNVFKKVGRKLDNGVSIGKTSIEGSGANQSIQITGKMADSAMLGQALFSREAPVSGFSDENRRIREEDDTLWQKIKRQTRRQLTPEGLLPASVFDEKVARDANLAVVEFDTVHYIGALERAIRLEYGVRAGDLSEADQDALSSALGGVIPDSVKPKTKEAIITMRQHIDRMSLEYATILREQATDLAGNLNAGERILLNGFMEAGRIDPASNSPSAKAGAARQRNAILDKAKSDAKAIWGGGSGMMESLGKVAVIAEKIGLIETITSNDGQYVHRSYKAFDDPNWFRKVPDKVLDDARTYLMDRLMDGDEAMSQEDARKRARVLVEDILKEGTAYDNMEAFIKESQLGAKDLSVLKKRKQIAPEIRALLGQYNDPRVNYSKTVAKMGRLIWNQRFLDKVRELGMGNFLFTEDDRPPNTTQIAGDASEVYAPLNGLYTTREIKQAFKDALGKEDMADWYRTVVQVNGLVKFGKTVLSPTTAFRNWQSAMFFTLANGHFDLRHMKKSFSGFKEYFTQSGDAEKIAYLRRLKELGVVYDTAYAGEMMRLLDDVNLEKYLSGSTAANGLKSALNVAQKFYQYGDDFWKIIGFENEKQNLEKSGMSTAEAEIEAAERIRNTYPTYSMVGRGIQSLRRIPLVGTFVSFPAEIIRTSAHILNYAAKDLREPSRRAMGLKRIAGFAMVGAITYAAQALSKLMFDIDDDEEEAIRLQAAPWQKNSNLVFTGRDEQGNLQYFDISFIDPYNYFKRPFNAMMRDRPWEDEAASALSEILLPFFGTDIVAGSIAEILSNKKSSGGRVFNDSDTVTNKGLAIFHHMRETVQPGFASNLESTWNAIDGQVSPSGKKYDLTDEAWSWLGWRVSTLDPKTALYYRSFDFNDTKSDASQVLTRVLTNPNDVSEGDIVDAYSLSLKIRHQAYDEMIKIVDAARKSGLTNSQIQMVLRGSNVSRQDISALTTGRIPPWVPSTQSESSAARRARAIMGPEKANEIRRRYQRARQERSKQ